MTSRTVAPPAELDKETEEEKKKEKNKAQAALLVEVAEEMGLEFFRDPEGGAHARASHGETWSVGSSAFKRYLAGALYRSSGAVPREAALKDALGVLEARAIFDGEEMPVFVRVGRLGEAVYVDLGDPTWRVIEVSGKGWQVLEGGRAPVRFRRPAGMLALPEPERSGTLAELRPHINLPDGDEAWSLLAGWLVAALALAPQGPYPILAIRGEQGSGKSSASEACAAILDPRTAGLRALPHSLENLAVAAHNAHLLAFDNVSGIEPWLSDGLCRLATGGGFATRQLYVNKEEALFDATRPVLLNGIEHAATRGDLVDRLVVVELPRITDERRQTKRASATAFSAARPRVLAGLFDAVALALAHRAAVKIERPPRMADFAQIAVAAEPAMGVEPGTFLRAYTAAREEGAEAAAGADAVIEAIRNLIEMKGPWEGSATELLKVLPPPSNPRGWPRDATRMAGRLQRAAPTLRQLGIEVAKLPRVGARRRWRIAPASPASVTATSPENTNGNGQMTLVTPVTLSPDHPHTLPRPLQPGEIWTPAELAEARRALEGER